MSHSAPEAAATAEPTGNGSGQPNGEDLVQGQGATDPASETPGAGQGDVGQTEPDWKAEAERWKKASRQNEARAKENAAAAKKWQLQEDANKTELQKAQDRAEQAEKAALEQAAMHNRVMAAAMHDLPVSLIDVLGSGTEEEIGERAEQIAGAINTRAMEIAKQTVEAMGLQWPANGQAQPGSAPTAAGAAAAAGMARARPIETMRAGGAPSTGGVPTTREGMFRDMIGLNG